MKTTPVDPICDRCGKPKSQHILIGLPRGSMLECNLPGSGGVAPFSGFRRRAIDMPRLAVAPHPNVPLGSYVHVANGGRYEVIGGVFAASGEGDDVAVLYQSVEHGFLAHRPPAEFGDKFKLVMAKEPLREGQGV